VIKLIVIIQMKPLHSARVHHLLKRIGSEHHKLKSAITQVQMVIFASPTMLCTNRVVTLPLQVISFRKLIMNCTELAGMSAFGIHKI
jgi:hypothetical protein